MNLRELGKRIFISKSGVKKSFLTDEKISHISFVNKGAIDETFYIAKSKDGIGALRKEQAQFICKEDGTVVAAVNIPDKVDAHGDYSTAEEIIKAFQYVQKNGIKLDTNHNMVEIEKGVSIVENRILEKSETIGDVEVPAGSWIMKFKIDKESELWKSIEAGEITGLSRFGTAIAIEKKAEEPEVIAKQDIPSILKKWVCLEVCSDNMAELLADLQSAQVIAGYNLEKGVAKKDDTEISKQVEVIRKENVELSKKIKSLELKESLISKGIEFNKNSNSEEIMKEVIKNRLGIESVPTGELEVVFKTAINTNLIKEHKVAVDKEVKKSLKDLQGFKGGY